MKPCGRRSKLEPAGALESPVTAQEIAPLSCNFDLAEVHDLRKFAVLTKGPESVHRLVGALEIIVH